MDGMGQVGVVLGAHAGHWNTTVVGQVDRELLDEALHLGAAQAGEAEHADLGGDVTPVVRGALLAQIVHQWLSHRDDTVSHAFHLAQPFQFFFVCSQF